MKAKVAILILIVIAIGLGVCLVMTNQKVHEMQQSAERESEAFSNNITAINVDFSNRLALSQAAMATAKAETLNLTTGILNLGLKYIKDNSDTNGSIEAVNLFCMAADHGSADAQNILGFMYDNGDGVTNDSNEAIKWYSKAADQGLVDAEYHLGLIYADPEGGAMDSMQAVKWFRKAADVGYAPAQYSLANLLRLGLGIAQDKEAARHLVEQSASQGYLPAVTIAGILETTREDGDTNQGLLWLQGAANADDPWAQSQLAYIFLEGRLVTQDYYKALYWIERAHTADPNNTDGLWHVVWETMPSSVRGPATMVVAAQLGHDLSPPPLE
jgi:TPR repeat protein